jgi:hypothetical protein
MNINFGFMMIVEVKAKSSALGRGSKLLIAIIILSLLSFYILIHSNSVVF